MSLARLARTVALPDRHRRIGCSRAGSYPVITNPCAGRAAAGPAVTAAKAQGRRPAAALVRLTRVRVASAQRGLGLAASSNELVTDPGGKDVVCLLQPGELCLQVMPPLLEAAHFSKHAGIRPADVAE